MKHNCMRLALCALFSTFALLGQKHSTGQVPSGTSPIEGIVDVGSLSPTASTDIVTAVACLKDLAMKVAMAPKPMWAEETYWKALKDRLAKTCELWKFDNQYRATFTGTKKDGIAYTPPDTAAGYDPAPNNNTFHNRSEWAGPDGAFRPKNAPLVPTYGRGISEAAAGLVGLP